MTQVPSPGSRTDLGHVFVALDGLRGVAAISVLLFHYGIHLGWNFLPNASLAVDFFFALSGFVIAHAYEKRLRAGQSFGDFMRRRVIRLYPLYWVGLTLPLLLIGLEAAFQLPHFNRTRTFAAYLFGLLFLPTPSALSPVDDFVFPLNDPAWSLSLEIGANALYAAFAIKLTDRRLTALILIAAAALVASALTWHGLDLGNTWSQYLGGWARVLWSFFAGILLYRLYDRRERRALTPWAGIVLILAILAIFALPRSGPAMGLASALVLFPAIIWIGAKVRLTGPASRIASWLGTTSYALYITHVPLLGLGLLACRLLGIEPERAFLPSILVGAVGALAVAWLLDGVFDVPVRRMLQTGLRRPLRAARSDSKP